VVYSAGRDAVLAVIAPASCNLGMLHHQARRLATRLGALLAGPS
jgi:predicted regulator of Ras-like GTPase activity (Roadblock/LC7/MglB family)